MNNFFEKINLDGFSIETVDISEIEKLSKLLPKNQVYDLNLAEQGLISTLHGQNLCQELIAKIDYWISVKEGDKNKAWAKAALDKADISGHKAVKNREWFALADDDYITSCNNVAIAKAFKRWLENKASFFSGWHYAFKGFLKRDYILEKSANTPGSSTGIEYNSDSEIFVTDPFGE